MKNEKKSKKILDYNIGVDIGVASDGYAVTDMDGNLLKFKGKPMYGVRLFESGEPAAKRRVYRGTRRRYSRRRQRIELLRSLVESDMNKVDDQFFRKMDESFLHEEDRSEDVIGSLCEFLNKDYYKTYPTIYHLRNELMNADKQFDFRLVYLAIHHIIKYRGNFLYEGQNINPESNIASAMDYLQTAVNNIELFDFTDEIKIEITKVINSDDKMSDKQEKIKNILKNSAINETEFSKLITNRSGELQKIFDLDSSLKIYISKLDEKEDDISQKLDEEQMEILYAVNKLYLAYTLKGIISADTLSKSMIEKFEKHGKDLESLKRIFKKIKTDETKEFLHGNSNKSLNMYLNNISKSKNDKKSGVEYIWDIINGILDRNPSFSEDTNYKYCKKQIENENFLLKLNSTDNGAIPFQYQKYELEKILEKQGKYYPTLKENKEKIISILSFRIPYYVGPLNNRSNFAWIQRDYSQKIYPWNIGEVIDLDKTAESFIIRMTNKCTYLYNEDVVPKNSILFSVYTVLNELNKVKIDGKPLSVLTKKEAIIGLFSKTKNVTLKTFKNWLIINKYYTEINTISGTQKEDKFASTLAPYIDAVKVLGEFSVVENSKEKEIAENLILWCTLFNEKSIIKKRIISTYPELSDKVDTILKWKYTGWGSLSRKLLTGIKVKDRFENNSIMDLLWNTNDNFMQIINKYGFLELFDEENKKCEIKPTPDEFIDGLACSPADKKGIRQCVKVIQEIISIQGCEPKNIFFEVARDDERKNKKDRKNSRYKELEKIYNELKNNIDYKECYNELKEKKEKDLDDLALFLYFRQNGKCMYSEKKLNINMLSSYQIDHIVPRSYIKDDSIDNKVLVISKENQRKLDTLSLNNDIIANRIGFWKSLLNNKLISQKKFDKLTKPINEGDMKGFVARQLVETRQITRYVLDIMKLYFPNINVVTVKAEFTHNIREQYGLYKIRNLNDTHHAFDAYAACLEGLFVQKCYPNYKSDFDYKDYRKVVCKKYIKDASRTLNGFFAYKFSDVFTDEDGVVIWDGAEKVKTLHKQLIDKRCFISKKVERQNGSFFNETLVGKDSKPIIPLKKDLDCEKYGGYNGNQDSYYCAFKYKKGKKENSEIIGIPIRFANQITDTARLIDYIYSRRKEKVDSKNDITIIKSEIKKYQLFSFEGDLLCFVASGEVNNMRQFFLDYNSMEVLYKLQKGKIADDEANNKCVVELYKTICFNIINYLPCYKTIGEKLLEAEPCFVKLNLEEKCNCINDILSVVSSTRRDLKKYKLEFTEKGSKKYIAEVGRMQKNINPIKICFIDKSITGMIESN